MLLLLDTFIYLFIFKIIKSKKKYKKKKKKECRTRNINNIFGLSWFVLFVAFRPHHSLTQTLLERLVNASQQDFVVAHLTHAVVERRATPTNTNRKRVCRMATTCATALSPNKQHVRARKALANGAVAQTLNNEFVAFDHFVLVAGQVHH